MLSINKPIVYTDIYNIVALSPGHPVFRLDGWGDGKGKVDSIVIKQESTHEVATSAHRRDVRVATQLMTMVDSNAKTVVLSTAEVQQLKTYSDGGNVADSTGLATAAELKRLLGNPRGVWTKMEVKKLLSLDHAMAGRQKGDKTDVRVIAAALKNPGGLEKLGKIIAVDLFNGNNDRFVWPPPGQKDPSMPRAFQAIWNIGNVMIASGSPIGLDSFDPANDFNKMTMDVRQHTVNPWAGVLLIGDRKVDREKFVRDVIDDLEMALGPRNRKIAFASTNRLGTNRTKRLLDGMLAGRKIIQQAVVPLKNRPNLPIGMVSRIAVLGW